MKYYIETRTGYEVKNTYREAEIFCCENSIYPENIIEISEKEFAELA